jgi:hypothetical protein
MGDALADTSVPVLSDDEEDDSEEEQEGEEESDVSSVRSEQFVYHPDDISEYSEDAEERRYLIDTHSFMHLKDPGLADALLLKGMT